MADISQVKCGCVPFLELKEETKFMVEYPEPKIRRFSNILKPVHLLCQNRENMVIGILK